MTENREKLLIFDDNISAVDQKKFSAKWNKMHNNWACKGNAQNSLFNCLIFNNVVNCVITVAYNVHKEL